MIITIKKDFRTFKQGEVIDLSVMPWGFTTIVGDNGCGKTSLFQAIRGHFPAQTKSLYESDYKEIAENIEIEHSYEKVLFFDAVNDNGLNFQNAYDAVNYATMGGFAKQNLSHGQGTMNDIGRLIARVKKEIVPQNTLLVLDEVDNGLSLVNMTKFRNVVTHLASLGCEVLVVSHNPFFIHQSILVYDLETRQTELGKTYIRNKTGFDLSFSGKE